MATNLKTNCNFTHLVVPRTCFTTRTEQSLENDKQNPVSDTHICVTDNNVHFEWQ